MNSKSKILHAQVKTFFENKQNIDILFKCLKMSNPISLRLIDWFVTNYCKHNCNKIALDMGTDIYNSYKGQLKAYNKVFFDPFCRNSKIESEQFGITYNYDYQGKEYVFYSSLAQLNFFMWAINKNVIKYIEENMIIIKQENKKKMKERKNKKKVIPTTHEIDKKLLYTITF